MSDYGIWAFDYQRRQPINRWVKSYDPDAHEGEGDVQFTLDPTEALHFADAGDAMILWNTQSTVRPWRADGHPNKPLAALSVEVRRFDDDGVTSRPAPEYHTPWNQP